MRVIDSDAQSLQIVLETDLARLKGQLAAWWGNAEFASLTPYVPVVIAAQEYAASWRTWEMKPYLDLDGRPIDAVFDARYIGPHWIELYVEAVASLAQRDAYAALMASLHWEMLLERVRDAWPPGLEAAIADQQLLRGHLIAALWEEGAYRLETDAAHLAANVAVLNALDTLATGLLTRAVADSPVVVIATGSGEVDLHIRPSGPEQVAIEPYPFGVDPLEVSWTIRTLPDRAFRSRLEFLEHFYRAPRLHRSCTLASVTLPE